MSNKKITEADVNKAGERVIEAYGSLVELVQPDTATAIWNAVMELTEAHHQHVIKLLKLKTESGWSESETQRKRK